MESGTTRGALQRWMSDFPEEIPAQLKVNLEDLGEDGGFDDVYLYFQIFRLPPDANPGDIVHPDEYIQAGGIAARLTVEIRRIEADGQARQYAVGRPVVADEPGESEIIRIGDFEEVAVRPAEVLTSADAFDLFQHYYDHHRVPEGWHLRPVASEVLAARDDENDERS